ncbi:hypothetical protein QYE76_020990 [Lolium multiflorum]|uniref:RNase H type-1 domain-containing protein n=1 Tax=Lolium multiflorum TaxID=4521 RepID=A0AAD8R5T7_LOLMU|nr:hypothetical protein QYE76_020990 [Lolium multiflorum]
MLLPLDDRDGARPEFMLLAQDLEKRGNGGRSGSGKCCAAARAVEEVMVTTTLQKEEDGDVDDSSGRSTAMILSAGRGSSPLRRRIIKGVTVVGRLGICMPNGRIIEFGSHRIYFGIISVRQCLSPVLVAPDPPRWLCAGRAAGSVEVMMAGAVGAGKEAVEEGAGRTASTRPAKPPLERDAGAAGASSAPPETPLQAAMNVLATPIAQNIDPAAAQAELEATRKTLLSGGADIIRAQRELNLTLREYSAAHGFASVSAQAARMPENRLKARNLDQDLRKEVFAGKSASVSLSIVEKPKYSSPDKTIKAVRAAVELCEPLTGDALAKQQDRVTELLDVLEAQNAELAKANRAVAASKSMRSIKNAGSKSQGQASSPHPDRRREKEGNAGQMTVYDPVLAGKQQAGQYEAGRKNQKAGHGYAGDDYAGEAYAGNAYAGRGETGQNYRAPRAAYANEMPPPRYRQARAAVPEKSGWMSHSEDNNRRWKTSVRSGGPRQSLPCTAWETGIGSFHGLNPYGLSQNEDAGTSWTLNCGGKLQATNRVVSVVVVVEREEEEKIVQRPVYYLSEVLSLSKQNYPHFQKMTYGVFMAATKLKHYFEEHPMKVVSEAPISDIMGNKDASGRIAKWAIQLSPYVPVYERGDAIKSQALADFLVDWAEMQYKLAEHNVEYWKMHFDGSKLKEGLGAGVVLTSPKGDHLRYVLQVHFRASNNVAEYEALIHGLKVAKEIGAHQIICYGDSDLVVQQCSGDWDAKDANMTSYRFHVQKIAGFFEGCEFHHVPRAENEAADALSKLGSSRQEIPSGIALAHL